MTTFKSWSSYWSFELEVKRNRRYVRADEVEAFLAAVRNSASSRTVDFQKNSVFWRAQVGAGTRDEDDGYGNVFERECAFPPDRMKPMTGRASEGRANPRGIPYLYLATSKETAMSEVRPWVGAHVSVAQFEITRNLKIVDCSRGHDASPLFLEEPNPSEIEESVWKHIANGFSRPTTQSDHTADYVPTQILAELFKDEGYDGVAYKSNFGESGFNLVLFDIDAAELINCTLFRVKNIEMKFDLADNTYFVSRKKKAEN